MIERPFSHEYSETARTLTLHGEVDESASVALRELLRGLTAEPVGELTVDLTDVDFLPSVAVGVLASARGAAVRDGGDIAFVAATGTIAQRVLTICGIAHEAVDPQ